MANQELTTVSIAANNIEDLGVFRETMRDIHREGADPELLRDLVDGFDTRDGIPIYDAALRLAEAEAGGEVASEQEANERRKLDTAKRIKALNEAKTSRTFVDVVLSGDHEVVDVKLRTELPLDKRIARNTKRTADTVPYGKKQNDTGMRVTTSDPSRRHY